MLSRSTSGFGSFPEKSDIFPSSLFLLPSSFSPVANHSTRGRRCLLTVEATSPGIVTAGGRGERAAGRRGRCERIDLRTAAPRPIRRGVEDAAPHPKREHAPAAPG